MVKQDRKFYEKKRGLSLPGEITSISLFSASIAFVPDRPMEPTFNPIKAHTHCRALSEEA